MRASSQSGPRRFLAGTLLVFQFAVLAAVPMADAALEAAVREGPVHVEASNDGVPCPPGHDHRLCQFCRITSPTLLPVLAGVTLPRGHGELVVRSPAGTDGHALLRVSGSIGPRAPPLV